VKKTFTKYLPFKKKSYFLRAAIAAEKRQWQHDGKTDRISLRTSDRLNISIQASEHFPVLQDVRKSG
jgi:hypothetical protein